ncbi:MAG: DUF1343 domain-containing protein [Bacteroidales bacterium]|nr:DUF1343 domain-containing protein [Bacteroidales bacterium]
MLCFFLFCSFFLSFAQLTVGAERTELYIDFLKDKNVAVCANQTSVVGDQHLIDTLLSRGIKITKIFCVEHGFRGDKEAGAKIVSSIDEKTGIPLISLYGNAKKPTKQQLVDVDVVLFDIQDVGCRFYTYISTLHYLMEAVAENEKGMCILDRPNPNGFLVDGPMLDPKYRSFVGMHPVPIAHGMTIGEYALFINGEKLLANGICCPLQIVEVENWRHSQRYDLPISPSPNLTSYSAVVLYPTLCLFEGTAISVGRGTEDPFTCFGHPSLKIGDYFFTPHAIKGVAENPPCNGERCRGFDLKPLANNMMMRDNMINIDLIIKAYNNFPNQKEFFLKNNFFDKLAGTPLLREQIIHHLSAEQIRASWKSDLENFKKIRKKYLLYPDFE